jgi:serine/threonine protein kinase
VQLIEGIHILHKFGIIHRDIKTTNIMIEINSPIKKSIISNSFGTNDIQITYEDMSDFTLKIIDFGLSKVIGVNETTDDPYGSLSFKAPELILHKNYNFKVDIWAMGISLYYVVYKMLPFDEGTREDIKKAIVNNPVIYYENELLFDAFYYKNYNNLIDQNSREIKSSIVYSILKDSLIKDPMERYSIEDLYNKYCDLIKSL